MFQGNLLIRKNSKIWIQVSVCFIDLKKLDAVDIGFNFPYQLKKSDGIDRCQGVLLIL